MNTALGDIRVLGRLLRGMPDRPAHRDRLEGFYAGQAQDYDRFRERLLHGRAELCGELANRLPDRAVIVELGGGTGRTLEFLGDVHRRLARVWLVDLCPSLLAQAAGRQRVRGWRHVWPVEADACAWRPPTQVDAVICSYSLTMIPDWYAAVDAAQAMLKPGGLFAACDFYVSRRHPEPGLVRHGSFARHAWPAWFAHDGVRPSPDHLPYLRRRFSEVWRQESASRLPWLPFKAPWYGFIGKKTGLEAGG
jgi:S-adenosylmethionine-diacylgycerolhomoserine-N-methlytransferase